MQGEIGPPRVKSVPGTISSSFDFSLHGESADSGSHTKYTGQHFFMVADKTDQLVLFRCVCSSPHDSLCKFVSDVIFNAIRHTWSVRSLMTKIRADIVIVIELKSRVSEQG